MAITTVKIYPPIGIARLGNSPSDFFIGPELPGDRSAPEGGYKDGSCRIKRQAARFRLFGFDATGKVVGEITHADATITWTVHVANRKAAAAIFDGLTASLTLRNSQAIAGVPPVTDRSVLVIDPGPRSLTGPNQAAGFNTGTFLGVQVPLGEMRTDADGLLLVLGGFGFSSSPPGLPLRHFANNDRWHDDVSDGPVTAAVTLNGTGTTLQAVPGWVICAPPDFAPPIDSVTTLYDVLFEVAVEKGWLTIPAKPSLTNDIHPILQRTLDIQYVSAMSSGKHDVSFAAAFPAGKKADRQKVFVKLNDPGNVNGVSGSDMPMLYNDSDGPGETLTRPQYAALRKWRDGQHKKDWSGGPPPPDSTITPDGLTRAALDACVGGAFFPGIEASWHLRDTLGYLEPFRLDPSGLGPGDITEQMAVPWQADFTDCTGEGAPLAWWPAQRPDDVYPEGGGGQVPWIRDLVASPQDMVANWYKLGFVVRQGNVLVETERHKVCSNLFMITDKSEFSADEVAGQLTAGSPAQFDDALYVVAEAFLPADLGVTTATPSAAQLAVFAPSLTLHLPDGFVVPGMTAAVQGMLLEDTSLPAKPQRFTFVYRIAFTDQDAFAAELTTVTVNAAKAAPAGAYHASGTLQLIRQPNPYMLDGPISWLSTDIRVFQIREGETRFGQVMGTDAAGAHTFLSAVLSSFSGLPAKGHPFDTLPSDEAASPLELSERVGGKRVFNFAFARVRYRGKTLDANDVRVFFRLFTTAATGTDYDVASTYRHSPTNMSPVALLGLQGGEVVTIPCYGDPRVDTSAVALTTQTDSLNRRNLVHAGAEEIHGFYGCWLDINQTTPRFPNHPSPPNGPWPAGLQSIQQLIRGLHQCLVAEVYFVGDPVPHGATPVSSDKLSQRNLAIVQSDNPGNPASRTVAHTFEIRAARRGREGTAGERDELMIRWGNLPPDAVMTLYLPRVDVDDLLKRAALSYEAERLQRVDAHTIRCLPGDVTYLPLPEARATNMAALLTVQLPATVRKGQRFRIVAHQISGHPRRLQGAFQLTIPVGDGKALRGEEERALSVLRHIGASIPVEEQWYAVFARYLDIIAGRVRGFGGNPDTTRPSPDGSGVPSQPAGEDDDHDNGDQDRQGRRPRRRR